MGEGERYKTFARWKRPAFSCGNEIERSDAVIALARWVGDLAGLAAALTCAALPIYKFHKRCSHRLTPGWRKTAVNTKQGKT